MDKYPLGSRITDAHVDLIRETSQRICPNSSKICSGVSPFFEIKIWWNHEDAEENHSTTKPYLWTGFVSPEGDCHQHSEDRSQEVVWSDTTDRLLLQQPEVDSMTDDRGENNGMQHGDPINPSSGFNLLPMIFFKSSKLKTEKIWSAYHKLVKYASLLSWSLSTMSTFLKIRKISIR